MKFFSKSDIYISNKILLCFVESFFRILSSDCRKKPRLQAANFIAGDRDQHDQLRRMGIKIITMADGRVQLLHTAADVSLIHWPLGDMKEIFYKKFSSLML